MLVLFDILRELRVIVPFVLILFVGQILAKAFQLFVRPEDFIVEWTRFFFRASKVIIVVYLVLNLLILLNNEYEAIKKCLFITFKIIVNYYFYHFIAMLPEI